MKEIIGFLGGHSVFSLGPVEDVLLFFTCIKIYRGVTDFVAVDDQLLDRLYRRYLTEGEEQQLSAQMARVQEYFNDVASSAVPWGEMGYVAQHSTLDVTRPTLGAVLNQFFNQFFKAVEARQSLQAAFGASVPVRLIKTDAVSISIEKRRPLSEYESPSLRPFWKD